MALRVDAVSETPILALTIRQVAARLQLGRNAVYALVQSGELPVLRFGRGIRVSAVVLERWVEERSAPAKGPRR